MKRTDLRTLLTAAQANGTLIGVAVRDKPDAPLFGRPEIAESIRAGFRLAYPGQPIPKVDFDIGEPTGEHITLAGDTVTSEPATVDEVQS